MRKLVLLAVVSTLSTPAFCADSIFYSGTSLGHTSVSNPTTEPLTKSSDNVFGGFLGYRINENLGLEGAYTGIGRYRNTTQSGKADALSLALVGFLPVSEHFELIGKVGVADAFGRSSKGGLGNTNRLTPMVGIGVQYNPTESIGIRFGVDRYEAAVKQASVSQSYNSNVIAATFVYRF
jgi:OmpA-OmpF porin, OOP family